MDFCIVVVLNLGRCLLLLSPHVIAGTEICLGLLSIKITPTIIIGDLPLQGR
jgi:hypothetical protein